MARVTLNLPAGVAQKLEDKAHQNGQSLETYLEQLAQRDAKEANGTASPPAGQEAVSDVEFEQLLDQLSEGPTLPHLPADFSRADIYADHD